MGLLTIQPGASAEVVSPAELRAALIDQDTRNRATLAGVKFGELFIPVNQIGTGPGANSFTTSGAPPQSPAASYVWAIMNVGVELSAASQVRLYKGAPLTSGAPAGSGRFVAQLSNFITTNVTFSKGQFMLRSGDSFTLTAVTGGSNILSVFASYIEVPAERIGELLL